MFKYSLTAQEVTLLNKFLSEPLKQRLQDSLKEVNAETFEALLDADTACDIRSECMDKYQVSGMDENYASNELGLMLDVLIEKFYWDEDTEVR